MEIANIDEYGVFDTAHAFPGWKKSSGRVLTQYELELYTSDFGEVIVDGTVYDVSAGALLCACPGQVRASVFDFRCRYLHLSLPEHSPYRSLLESLPNFYRIIDRDTYGRIFEELFQHLLAQGEAYDEDYVSAKLLELFYYLRKDAERNRKYLAHSRRHRESEPLLPLAIEYMKQNYQKPITLSDIAAVTGYSPNYFHHVFTEVMGRTPLQYLMGVRIRHAKYLLAQSQQLLSDIAFECGFSSQAYFTEQFKRATDSTPGQYRKQCMSGYLP